MKAEVLNFLHITEEKDDKALERLLKGLGIRLTCEEARKICKLLDRNPTVPEAFVFNSAWSEHCSYKSSRAVLKKYLPTKASHVIIGPGEDSGVVALGTHNGTAYALVVGHESHNHPSQLLPVDGAATGIGGIVRDVYCMGAEVVGVLDALRFGDVAGRSGERAKEICRGVVDGIWQYANAIGVPNLGGDTYFDSCYDENCLVNVIAVGIVEEAGLIHSCVPDRAAREPYAMLLVGKPTDESGFGGASFASAILDGEKEERGAVQVADPFLKRVLTEASKKLLELVRNEGIMIGWKDLGAGGLVGATSELAAASGFGVDVNLDDAPQEWEGIRPEVLLCAETQERYALAVPETYVGRILRIYNEDFELPKVYPGACAAKIGKITTRKFYRAVHKSKVVCDLPLSVLAYELQYNRPSRPRKRVIEEGPSRGVSSLKRDVLKVLASQSCCSKEALYSFYDTEVQGRSFMRPGEGDASVFVPMFGSTIGVAVSVDGNPRYGKVDPYYSGVAATAESIRNVISVGALPLALTDCLNFGSPEDPEVFWEFEQAVKGIGDAARALGLAEEPVPIVSGNVSFYNESSVGKAIAPSPIVACFGKLDDFSRALTMQLMYAGDRLLLVGERSDLLGGSVYAELFGGFGSGLPPIDLSKLKDMHGAVFHVIQQGKIESCHDISDGGLIVSLVEMLLAASPDSPLGFEIELSGWQAAIDHAGKLFSEAPGFIIEVRPHVCDEVRELMRERGVACIELGSVTDGRVARVSDGGKELLSLKREELYDAWSKYLKEVL